MWRLLTWLWGRDDFIAAGESRTAKGSKRDRTVRGHRNTMSETTFLQTLSTPKDPSSEEIFNWDFTDMLAPTDAVASVTTMFVQAGDASLTLLGSAALEATGTKVSRKLGGGRRGTWYEV